MIEVQGDPGATRQRPLDARALTRHALRLMGQPAPWLHAEVARRMAERLALLKQAPRRIIDWGADLGGSGAALRTACAQAQLVEVQAWTAVPTAPGLRAGDSQGAGATASPTPPWWSARRWWRAGVREGVQAGSAPALPESALPDGEADLLWSNMVLHHRVEPQASMARWLRLLSVDGLLMFSTLGPGTLESLRRLYAEQRWPPPHAPFVDMHDLGDMLVRSGFADPVMDQEVLTLTWPTAGAALAELRQLGGNAALARHAGLRTPRWRTALEEALQQQRVDGRVALEFEIVYGHAVRPPPRARVTDETAVSLADMRGMLRSTAAKGHAR